MFEPWPKWPTRYHRPFRPTPNGRRPPETDGHLELLQRSHSQSPVSIRNKPLIVGCSFQTGSVSYSSVDLSTEFNDEDIYQRHGSIEKMLLKTDSNNYLMQSVKLILHNFQIIYSNFYPGRE